jgi:NAD+ synthetase
MTQSDCRLLPDDDDFHAWLKLLHVSPSADLLEYIGTFLTTYLAENALSCYILGVSGGIDSGFLAALMHYRNIPFKAFSLAIHGNAPEEIARAHEICCAYAPSEQSPSCDQSLSSLYTSISASFSSVFPETSKIAEGNLKARSRMLFLYHAAQMCQGCVLSTDQLDELLTGFWTLHGDVGDISPLQLIPKTTEYALAEMLCSLLDHPEPLEAAIAATPTDGLGITSSDLDQLGVPSYLHLEELFREYFTLRIKVSEQALSAPEASRLASLRREVAIQRFEMTRFKRRGPLVFNPCIPSRS